MTGGNDANAGGTTMDAVLTLPGGCLPGMLGLWVVGQNGLSALTTPPGATVLSGPDNAAGANNNVATLLYAVLTPTMITAGTITNHYAAVGRPAACGIVLRGVGALDIAKGYASGLSGSSVASAGDWCEVIGLGTGRNAATASTPTMGTTFTVDKTSIWAIAGAQISAVVGHAKFAVGKGGTITGPTFASASSSNWNGYVVTLAKNYVGQGIPV